MANSWKDLSSEITAAIERAGRSIVAVDSRAGHTASGILWRDRFVLAAAHSVRNENGMRVFVAPDRSVHARAVGRDRGTDLALLELSESIEGDAASFAATASLRIGEFTVAVARTRRGNLVASSGIVSGLMGEWSVGRTRIDQFIRPDLNLYPGFSGGALIDDTGSILGMNTSGLVRGKTITIPSSTLVRLADEIAAKGHVVQPYVGLVMQPVQIPDLLQKKAGVDATAGLLVMHVEAGGPADSAGVLLGDVLIEMDGRRFEDLDDLHDVLRKKRAGDEVQTIAMRGGARLQIPLRVGERPVR